MSVVSVTARIDGRIVAMQEDENNRWVIPSFPATVTGHYIVEIWAEDDHGNVGYSTAVITLEAGRVTCCRIIDEAYRVTMTADAYDCEIDEDRFTVKMEDCTA